MRPRQRVQTARTAIISNMDEGPDLAPVFDKNERKVKDELKRMKARSSRRSILYPQIHGLCDIKKEQSKLIRKIEMWGCSKIPDFPKPEIEVRTPEKKVIFLKPRTTDARNFLWNIETIVDMLNKRVKHKTIGDRFNINPKKVRTLTHFYLKKRSKTIRKSIETAEFKEQLMEDKVRTVSEVCEQLNGTVFTVKDVMN